MPIRVKAKQYPERDFSPVAAKQDHEMELPQIAPDDTFQEVVRKLSIFFTENIDLPSSFEQLRNTSAGEPIRLLTAHLCRTCINPAIVNGLLALRWHYNADGEHRHLSDTRANACEIVAWRFVARQSERDAVSYCLHEIPGKEALNASPVLHSQLGPDGNYDVEANERSPLLAGPMTQQDMNDGIASRRAELENALPKLTLSVDTAGDDIRSGIKDRTNSFKNLNALEIAVIASAKRFLSQHIVQKIITSLWHGEIIFWDQVSIHATKKPRYYNIHTADPYSRLRVPKYLKVWEMAFFIIFLVLYYSVVLERSYTHLPVIEVVFYFWLASFAWDEFLEWWDAGIFYMSDIWNVFDVCMITIGVCFAVLRLVGISTNDNTVNDIAFDVLSLEALLVIPRIGSFLSLSPYWGTIIPCLKEMGKDFVKFMILVVIIYLGFLTTFSLLARDTFTYGQMTWNVTKIFYGNTGIAFDIMKRVDPSFGPPLFILFITLTSILLNGSLTGMLSNSFGRVMSQAKEEYLYFYSVYVLEASTSSRLTHFYPPFNLITLGFFRPFQILFRNEESFRYARVVALKATHWPFVGLIFCYEWMWRRISDYKDKDEWANFSGGRTRSNSELPSRRISLRNKGAKRYGPGSRHVSDRLSPDMRGSGVIRPPSGTRSDTSGESVGTESEGVSNAELLRRIDHLTQLVMAMKREQGGVGGGGQHHASLQLPSGGLAGSPQTH